MTLRVEPLERRDVPSTLPLDPPPFAPPTDPPAGSLVPPTTPADPPATPDEGVTDWYDWWSDGWLWGDDWAWDDCWECADDPAPAVGDPSPPFAPPGGDADPLLPPVGAGQTDPTDPPVVPPADDDAGGPAVSGLERFAAANGGAPPPPPVLMPVAVAVAVPSEVGGNAPGVRPPPPAVGQGVPPAPGAAGGGPVWVAPVGFDPANNLADALLVDLVRIGGGRIVPAPAAAQFAPLLREFTAGPESGGLTAGERAEFRRFEQRRIWNERYQAERSARIGRAPDPSPVPESLERRAGEKLADHGLAGAVSLMLERYGTQAADALWRAEKLGIQITLVPHWAWGWNKSELKFDLSDPTKRELQLDPNRPLGEMAEELHKALGERVRNEWLEGVGYKLSLSGRYGGALKDVDPQMAEELDAVTRLRAAEVQFAGSVVADYYKRQAVDAATNAAMAGAPHLLNGLRSLRQWRRERAAQQATWEAFAGARQPPVRPPHHGQVHHAVDPGTGTGGHGIDGRPLPGNGGAHGGHGVGEPLPGGGGKPATPKPTVGPRTIDPSTLPLPHGTSNSQFGELLNWPRGTGDAAAKMRMAEESLKAVTPQMLSNLKATGVTPQMLNRWIEFYTSEVIRVPQNPTAAARAFYLEGLLKLMGGV